MACADYAGSIVQVRVIREIYIGFAISAELAAVDLASARALRFQGRVLSRR